MPVETRLKDICAGIVRRSGFPLRPLPEQPAVAKMVDTMVIADAAPLPDPERFAREIVAAVESGQPFSSRQTRRAPWCLWSGEMPLCRSPRIANAILHAVRDAERPGPFRSLAGAFLAAYRRDLPGLAPVSALLSELTGRWPEQRWSDLHQRYRIFDPAEGPRRLGEAAIQAGIPVPTLLTKLGCDAIVAKGGLAEATTAALLESLAGGAVPDHLLRLEAIRRLTLEDDRPLFPTLADPLAAAILKPFGKRTPEQETRDRVLDVLLGIFDDPRLSPSGRKLRLHAPYDATVTRWLTDQSLRQFLDIVEQTTDNPEQFRYRRAFWWAAYEAGLVSAAWVAFGREGSALARKAFGANAPFAELYKESKNVDPGHAVLLMEIGTGLIADWSHNGKCNVWRDRADPTAPRLFERRYGSNEVQVVEEVFVQDRDAFSHVSPATYSWQRTAARHLENMTGRRLPPDTYRVR